MNLAGQIQSITKPLDNPNVLRLFAALVYGWFVFQAISLWPVKDLLWGTEKIFYRHGFADGVVRNFIYQLVYESGRAPYVFYLHVISALISVADRSWSFIPRFTTWITGLMLFYSATEAFNSGMMIMLVMAFLMSFVYTKTEHEIRIGINRLIYLAACIQVCIVYFTAGVYKLSGGQWLHGDAVYYALMIDHYSHPMLQSKNLLSTWIPVAMNYTALGYQLLFPLLMLAGKWRWLFLIVGVIFHLFIGFAMHLWDFALAMLICYILFLDERKIIAFQNILVSLLKRQKR